MPLSATYGTISVCAVRRMWYTLGHVISLETAHVKGFISGPHTDVNPTLLTYCTHISHASRAVVWKLSEYGTPPTEFSPMVSAAQTLPQLQLT
jgi:hypothetical protein